MRDWFTGIIVNKVTGIWADVAWDNGDANLYVKVTDERRGEDKYWVMVTGPWCLKSAQ